jgi:hypothetical protein
LYTLINSGGGVSTTYRTVYDTLVRRLNVSVRVEGWDRVAIERELYFNLEDFFDIGSFKVLSGKLSLTISDVGVWAYNPLTIQDKLTIMLNGYIVYEGRSFKGTKTFEIKPEWVDKENYVRVELDGGRNNWCWLQVSNATLELRVSYSELDRDAVVEANESTTKKNKEYIGSVINTPSPNTRITPLGGDWVSGFVQFAQMLPQLLLFIVIMFIFIEIIRIFRR